MKIHQIQFGTWEWLEPTRRRFAVQHESCKRVTHPTKIVCWTCSLLQIIAEISRIVGQCSSWMSICSRNWSPMTFHSEWQRPPKFGMVFAENKDPKIIRLFDRDFCVFAAQKYPNFSYRMHQNAKHRFVILLQRHGLYGFQVPIQCWIATTLRWREEICRMVHLIWQIKMIDYWSGWLRKAKPKW